MISSVIDTLPLNILVAPNIFCKSMSVTSSGNNNNNYVYNNKWN